MSKLVTVRSFVALILQLLVITASVCRGDIASSCSQPECADGPSNSSSQLIQLSRVTEPLVAPDVEQNSSEANESNETTKYHLALWAFKYIDELKPGFEMLIKETSIDQRLANLAHVSNQIRLVNIDFSTINTGDARLDLEYSKLILGSKVDETRCDIEIHKVVSLLVELDKLNANKREFGPMNSSLELQEKHIRLAHLLDSYGRYESGSLSGKVHFFGSYTQCISTQLQLDSDKPEARTSTRYCMAKLDARKHLNSSLERHHWVKYRPNATFNVGICIPESCHSDSFKKHKHLLEELLYSQFELPKSIFHDQRPELKSVDCLPDEDSQFRRLSPGGKLLIATLLFWLVLLVIFTYADHRDQQSVESDDRRGGQQRNHWYYFKEALSLKRSWNDFTLENERQAKIHRVQLDNLNIIKVVGCVFVVYAHSVIAWLISVDGHVRAHQQYDSDPIMTALGAGTFVIDSFYVITGILMAFIATKRLHDHEDEKLPVASRGELRLCAKYSTHIMLSRYLRLVPLYFLVFWFKKSMVHLLGAGPNWDYGLNKATNEGSCQFETWASPFTFLAAFKPLNRQCLGQTWSVASDLLFTLILAPVIVIMTKRPKLASLMAVSICLLSISAVINALESIDHNLRASASEIHLHTMAIFLSEYSYIYTAPHYRVSSFLIGLIAGHQLYHYNEGSIKDWPRWHKGIATKLAFGFLITLIGVPFLAPTLRTRILSTHPLPPSMFFHFNATFRVLWSLASAIIYVRMATDWKDNYFMRNCAGKFWKIATKLNYPILLIHIDILSVQIQLSTHQDEYSIFALFSLFASSMIMSCVFGLILHVCVENPLDKLIRGYLDRFAGKTSKKGTPQKAHRSIQNESTTDSLKLR